MSISEKKKVTNAAYDKRTYTNILLKFRKEYKQELDNIANKQGLQTGTFCKKCIEYCIKNNIDISNNSDNG